jgi:hypothetical protein
MKEVLQKIALFFGLLALPVVLLFTIPYSNEFARHFIKDGCYNHGAWIFDRLTKNATPIDIAFIGSSHTIHAFQDQKMEEILGPDYHLTNLGYCRYGRNLQFVLLKLLLHHQAPKLIVIEVHEDEEKNSHDIFPYLADAKDLLMTPTLVNRDYFSDVVHGASARLECFKSEYIFTKKIPEPDTRLYGYGESNRIATSEELADNRNAWERRLARKSLKSVEKLQMSYPLAYLDKMIDLLKTRNIPFVFIYLPESGSKLDIPKYASYYRQFAPLMISPPSLTDKPEYWMDASHLNDKGSEILSEWMAEKLRKEFCLDAKN